MYRDAEGHAPNAEPVDRNAGFVATGLEAHPLYAIGGSRTRSIMARKASSACETSG